MLWGTPAFIARSPRWKWTGGRATNSLCCGCLLFLWICWYLYNKEVNLVVSLFFLLTETMQTKAVYSPVSPLVLRTTTALFVSLTLQVCSHPGGVCMVLPSSRKLVLDTRSSVTTRRPDISWGCTVGRDVDGRTSCSASAHWSKFMMWASKPAPS